MTSTLPQSFSKAHADLIGRQVLHAFRLAEAAQLDLNEFVIAYPAFKIIARGLRGGVLVFLQS